MGVTIKRKPSTGNWLKDTLACFLAVFIVIFSITAAILLNPVVWVVIVLLMIFSRMG